MLITTAIEGLQLPVLLVTPVADPYTHWRHQKLATCLQGRVISNLSLLECAQKPFTLVEWHRLWEAFPQNNIPLASGVRSRDEKAFTSLLLVPHQCNNARHSFDAGSTDIMLRVKKFSVHGSQEPACA